MLYLSRCWFQKRYRANSFLVSFDRKRVCSKIVRVDRRFKCWMFDRISLNENNATESRIFWDGVVFRKLKLFHDERLLCQTCMYQLFNFRYVDLVCLVVYFRSLLAPTFWFTSRANALHLMTWQKCTLCYQHTVSPGQGVKMQMLLSQHGVILYKFRICQ